MFNITTVQDCLTGLIGWKPSENPCAEPLAPTITASSSGMFFNDAHPLLSIDNIESIAPDFANFKFNTWDIAQTYEVGDRVRFSGVVYQSLTASNIGNQPDSSPIQWGQIDLFSEWLESKTRSFYAQFVNRIFVQKSINKITKSLFDDRYIFQGVGSFNDLIIKQGRFVGFEIIPNRQEDISLKLNKIGFQFNQIQTGFTLYVFHSSQEEAIHTETITTSGSNSFEWFNLSSAIELFYASNEYDAGGAFYIGYFEDDIQGQAIKKSFNFSRPCSTCRGGADFRFWRTWSKFFSITPVSFGADALNGNFMPDIDLIREESTNNFGMNLNVSAECDLSEFLCRHLRQMTFPLMKYVGLEFVKEFANSIRLNREKSELQQKALIELDDRQGSFTLKQEVENLMKDIDFSFSDLNSACMPCNEKNGINHKAG
jgi:hypothetical protein